MCRNPNVKVRLIGSGSIQMPGVNVEAVQWSNESEVAKICKFDVGIMPLPDEPWTRGKCGFKLIQYMACGLPVVASPVGVNADIVSDGVNGYLADTTDQWVNRLSRLASDHSLREGMGQEGRKLVEEQYCLQATAQRWRMLISKCQIAQIETVNNQDLTT